MKNVNLLGRGLLVALVITAFIPVMGYSQAPDVLGTLDTQLTTARDTLKTIFATLGWIFLGVGIVVMLYNLNQGDMMKSKMSIVSFIAGALILGVGYGLDVLS